MHTASRSPSFKSAFPSGSPRDASAPVAGSIAHILLGLPTLSSATLAFWVFLLVPHTIQDPDIWWHLRNAAIQLHSHRFLQQDTYSSTAFNAPWINHEWLAELPYSLAWRLAGQHGLYAVTLLTLEFIFLTLFWLAFRKSGSLPAALLATVLASFLSTVSFAPRTLLFGWALLLMELIILECLPRHPRIAFALPLLFALWINTHGSWLIGLILLCLFTASACSTLRLGHIPSSPLPLSQQRILCAALLLSFAALFLNPYGWHLIAYPFDLAFHQKLNIANVEEWQPLNCNSARGLVFLLSLATLLFSRIAFPTLQSRRCFSLCDLAFLALGTYAALIHARFLFLAAILVMPLLARELASFRTSSSAARASSAPTMLPTALLLSLACIACRATYTTRSVLPPAEDQFPASALPYLQTFHPQGTVLNAFLWGGYLDYYTPQIPVFIDSRVDIFERRGILRDYLRIVRLNNSLALLDTYHIRYVLFERDAPLIYLLQHTTCWKTDYDDGTVILLERTTPPASRQIPQVPLS